MKQTIICIGIILGTWGSLSAQRLWTGLRLGINEYNIGSITQRYIFTNNDNLDIVLEGGKNAETMLGADIYFETPSGFVVQGGFFYNFSSNKTFNYAFQSRFGNTVITRNEGEIKGSTGYWNLMLGAGYNLTHRSRKLIISPVLSLRYGNGVETFHEDVFETYDPSEGDLVPSGVWPVNSFYGGSAYLNVGLDFERFGIMFSPGATYFFRGDQLKRPPVFQADFTLGFYYAINLGNLY